jgi:anaerobic magnesium-protoporphyrin IX monomethyl ester cyclase
MRERMSTRGTPLAFEADLALVFPPFERPLVAMDNVGLGYLAAAARAAGFRCAIINAGLHGLTAGDVTDILDRSRFRVLGLSTIHWNMPATLEIAAAARRSHPGCHIILGGLEAAMEADRLLLGHPCLDSIGLGEGERTIAALLEALTAGREWRSIPGLAYREDGLVRRTGRPALIDPLDDLPFPARDDIAAVLEAGGPVGISTSRGCPGRCTFCSVKAFYGLSQGPPWRGRSPRSVVAEMREIMNRHGARLFSFIDETAAGSGRPGAARLAELAELIRTSGMKPDLFMAVRPDQVEERLFRDLRAAGLRKVEIGIESMAPAQLRRYRKGTRVEDNRRALAILRKLGLAVEILMIPFDPGVTPGELRTNLRFYRRWFADDHGYDSAPLNIGNYACPYPGTGMRAVYEKRGWIGPDGDARFRAADPRMEAVGRALLRFCGAVESCFPRSYMGLGNLWVNGAGLPESVMEGIGEACAESGRLVVDFAAWALQAASGPRPVPLRTINGWIVELRGFLARLDSAREGSVGLRFAHANRRPALPTEMSRFARSLHMTGRRKKRVILANELRSLDPYPLITGLLNDLIPLPTP